MLDLGLEANLYSSSGECNRYVVLCVSVYRCVYLNARFGLFCVSMWVDVSVCTWAL